MDFATVLSKISTGAQVATAVTPEIEQYGDDHVAATQQILQIAGAGVAAEASDKNVQAEAWRRRSWRPVWFRWCLSCSPGSSSRSRRQRKPPENSGQWIVARACFKNRPIVSGCSLRG
jgi:hypothetical protein